MRNVRRNSRLSHDRHNVADQPAGAIFLAGFFIALILGLAVRGALSPAKIRAQVESAAARIHPDVRADFETARVSLAQGLLPGLAVVVENVRLTSDNPCWMAPRVKVNELRLPVSVLDWLRGRPPSTRIEADELELRLTKTRPADCGTEAAAKKDAAVAAEKAAAADQGSPGVVTLVHRVSRESPRASGDVSAVDVNRLTIVSEVTPVGDLEFERVEFRVRGVTPKAYSLRARTRFLRDGGVGDYLSSALVDLNYKEFPERALDARLDGNWREGAYSASGTYALDSNEMRFEGELRHLPLSQLLLALKQAGGLAESEFSPRQSWVSFKAETAGSVKNWEALPVNLRDVRLEGDLGEISAEQVRIARLKPFRLVPSRIAVRELDLDRLLQFLNHPHPSPVLNRVGRFRGTLDLEDDRNFVLAGKTSGLELIFSNKGERELQTVNDIEGSIRRSQGKWDFRIEQALFDQGEFTGSAKLTADPEFNEADADIRTERLVLAPKVKRLMSPGGDIAPLEVNLQLHLRNGRPSRAKGLVRLASLALEGISFDDLQLQFDERAGDIVLLPRIGQLAIASASPAGRLLGSVVPESWVREGHLDLLGVTGQFRIADFNQIRWNKFAGRGPAGGQLSSDGGWDATGELDGRVIVRGKGEASSFRITGTRDEPRLERSAR